MGINNVSPDAELLFGVRGGGSISGESGYLIQKQLNKIIGTINSKPLGLRIGLDPQASNMQNWHSQLQQKIDSMSNKEKFSVKVSKLSIDKSALADFKKQLNAVINTLDLDKGTTVRIKAAGDIGETEAKVKGVGDALDEATVSATEFDNAITRSSKKSLGNNLNKNKLSDNTRIVKEYYSTLTRLVRSKGDVTLSGLNEAFAEYVSPSGDYNDLATSLNRTKSAYDLLYASMEKMPYEEKARLLTIITQEQNKYNAAIEDQAEKDRSAAAASDSNAQRLAYLKQIEDLIVRIQRAQTNWSAADSGETKSEYIELGNYITRLNDLKNHIEDMPVSELKKNISALNSDFSKSSRVIKTAGRDTKNLSDKFGGLAKKFASWLSVSQIIMKLYQALRKMVQVVVDIDTAMTELRKVTNETEAAYTRFLDKATERAKKLGTTISDTINATADFARLGYNLDEASALSDAAVVYKNVGDGIESINDASASIISTMKAFGVEVEDVMSIVDRFNEVGNNFAISSKGVGDALLNSASAMAAANNTLDESIALITAANSVVQNPEKVGTALKTTSMFLRAAKTEAEEAGESTDGMAESVSALREEILALTGNRVEIQIDKNTFKSSYEILRDLSKVWKDLSDITQANILEMIGGKRNSNVVAAILNNFEIAESVMESTANAAGSALAENEKYLQSIRGEISKFKAEFEELAVTLIGTEFAKEVVRFGTEILSVLNSVADLIDSIGGLQTVLSATVTGGLLFNLGGIGSQIDKLEAGARKLYKTWKSLPVILEMYKDGTAAALLHTDRFTALLKGLGVSASASRVALLGVFGVLTTVIALSQAYVTKLEEQKQATINSAKAFNEDRKAIEDYQQQIEKLKTSLDNNSLSIEESISAKEELEEIQKKLIDTYGKEAAGIDLVNGKLEDQLGILENVNKEKFNKWKIENTEVNQRIVDGFNDYNFSLDQPEIVFGKISESFKDALEKELKNGDIPIEIKTGYSNQREGVVGDIYFPTVDNIYEIQDAYERFYELVERVGKEHYGNDYNEHVGGLLGEIGSQSKEITDMLSEEESAFNTLAEGTLKFGDKYSGAWDKVLSAREKYNKAVKSKNYEDISSAIEEMEAAREELNNIFSENSNNYEDISARIYVGNYFSQWDSIIDSNEINTITELKSRFDSGLISIKEFREEVTKLKDSLLSAGDASFEVEEALAALELDKVEKLSQKVKSFVNKLSDTDPQSLGRSMVDDFGEGNVSLTNRKRVQNEDGSYSTVASEWVNDTVGGKEVAIHFTPILDGEFLDSNDINNYLDILLDGATSSSEILERDRNGLGIVLRVKEDFDFNTENAWGESLHLAQEEFYSAKEAAEELEKYIGEMTFDELKIAEELISTETFDSLDEFETRLNQINFAGAEMVNVLDFSDMFSGMNAAVEGLDNIISAMEALNNGTALTKNQLSSLAMEYPKLLEQANLFTDGSIEGQKNLLNTILESKEAEHDAHIDAKISELNATNEVLKMQIDLENMRKDKVLEIEELMTNSKLNSEADYQKILNELKDVEGDNFVTFEQGKLNVNKEALDNMLTQEGNKVDESADIYETQGDMVVEGFSKGLTNALKLFGKFGSKVGEWANTSLKTIASNIGENISKAMSGEIKWTNVLSGLTRDIGSLWDTLTPDEKVTIEAEVEGGYEVDGQNIKDWVSNYKETLDKRVEVINKQIEANEITIKNLESLKGLNLTDMYGSSSSVSGSSSGKSDAEKAVEEYQANIDAYYAAEKRLKEIIALHESLEKKLEHTNDLSEKIKITKELIEVYKDEAEAEQDLVEAKIDTIEANARALRKLGFDVIYDSDTNEFFIENLEHLNELTADSKGKYDSLQEATNALREETEKLIDTTEQLNDDNIEAAGSIEDLGYAVLEAKNNIIDYIEEIYGKQTEAYQKIINLRKELIESAKDELDYEDEIAERVKEIADLQTRIDQLSLDNSRSAQAERNTLMKELAEKQKELADTQDEHSTDAQLEALDKMAESFEKEKADEIELLKQTVDTSDELWSAFYDSILGKNVTIGESIDAEIASAWMNAANAVKEYSASVGSIGGVGTVVTSIPKYHDGGVVDEANLNKDEALAILQKGKVVLNDGKQQSLYRIIDFQTELSKKLGVALNNTPLFGARPNFGELASRLADNVQNVSNSIVFEPHIEVVIQGGTNMSESSAKAYGEQIANATIDKLYSAFERRGINSTRGSRLKP